MARMAGPGRILLTLPDSAVISDLDPDAFAIVLRNLIENALRHGQSKTPVEITLTASGILKVANDGPPISAEDLGRIWLRFERGRAGTDGSGLGLAIVAAIAERSGGALALLSPRPGQDDGFEARFSFTIETPSTGD